MRSTAHRAAKYAQILLALATVGAGSLLALPDAGAVTGPSVTALSANSGGLIGGQIIHLTGTGFTGTTAIQFNTDPAGDPACTTITDCASTTHFTVVSPTDISVQVPKSPTGHEAIVDVLVHTPSGTSAASPADQYAYLGAVPAVTGLSENVGAAGDTVTITGTGLAVAPTAAVYFGNVAASTVNVVNGTTITAQVPAPAQSNLVDVRVATPPVATSGPFTMLGGGLSATSPSDQFAYNTQGPCTPTGASPVVNSISPSSGPTNRSEAVTIIGSGFTGVTGVSFVPSGSAGTGSPFVKFVSDCEIIAIDPPGTGGTTPDVEVTAGGSTSPVNAPADQFSYLSSLDLAVTNVVPSDGPLDGGTAVTIDGSGFDPGSVVTFGGYPVPTTFVSSSKLTAATPMHRQGLVDAVVTDGEGATSPISSADGFTYLSVPVVTGVSPNGGTPSTTPRLTVQGNNFWGVSVTGGGAVSVAFCPTGGGSCSAGTNVTRPQTVENQIFVTAPSLPAGTYDVIVTTPGGVSSPVPADLYTIIGAPTVTSVAPTSGAIGRATPITIGGTNFYGNTFMTPMSVSFCQVPADTTCFAGTGVSQPTSVVTSITAVTPTALPIGKYDVEVTTPSGTSSPVAADEFTSVAAPSQFAVAVEGTNGAAYTQSPQLTPGWHSLGGVVIAPPAVIDVPTAAALSAPEYIATSSNHLLYVRSLSLGWQRLSPSGYCINSPAALLHGTTLYVACEGKNLAAYFATATLPASGLPVLGAWQPLGGVLSNGPAIAPVNGVVTFFVPGSNHLIYQRALGAPGWSRLSSTVTCNGHPAAAEASANPALGEIGHTTYVACAGAGGALIYLAHPDGGAWSAPTSLGGVIIAGPAVAATTSGPIFLVEGTNHGLWMRSLSSGWASLGGGLVNGTGGAGLN